MDETSQTQQQSPPPMSSPAPHSSSGGFMANMEAFFQKVFVDKAPFHLPEGVKEFIVKVSPWITLILLILALPILLAALGFSLLVAPVALATAHLGITYWIGWVIILATVVLQAMAIPLLMKRIMKGWRYVYWGMLLSVISNVLMLSIGGLVGNVIGLYFLFQVKSKYH